MTGKQCLGCGASITEEGYYEEAPLQLARNGNFELPQGISGTTPRGI